MGEGVIQARMMPFLFDEGTDSKPAVQQESLHPSVMPFHDMITLPERLSVVKCCLSLFSVVCNHHFLVLQGYLLFGCSLHHPDTPIDISRITILRIVWGCNGEVCTDIKRLMTNEHALLKGLPSQMLWWCQTTMMQEFTITIHNICITIKYSWQLRLICLLHNAADGV